MPATPPSPTPPPFCAAYGFDPQDSANCIVVASRRPAGQFLVAMVLATTRLDVNGRCCELMGVRRASFAPPEQTAELTGMEIGGVTPFGLPASLQPVRVDAAVLRRERVVVGGGDRSVKLVVDAGVFARAPLFEVVEGLAAAGPAASGNGFNRPKARPQRVRDELPDAPAGLLAFRPPDRVPLTVHNRPSCPDWNSSNARCGPDSRRCC